MYHSKGLVGIAVLVASAGLGCGGSAANSNALTLTISANPATVYVVPGAYTTLTISGLDKGAPFVDGTEGFAITTTYGSLGSVSTSVDNDTKSDPNETVMGHVITVALYADATIPANSAPAVVSVTYTDPYSLTKSASVSINFLPGNLTTACTPQNMQEGCVAQVEQLRLSCDSYNLGVFADMSDTYEEPCTANATDSLDQPVNGIYINYLAEAGTMKFDPTAGNLAYLPNDPNALHTLPNDTQPTDLDNYIGGANMPGTSAESTCCSWTDATGLTHNSRDGLVTIIAWVYADNLAVVNAPVAMYNGEPFVDANDNQKYDEGEDFIDLNGNHKWDAIQDPKSQTALWVQIKILWSGHDDPQPPIVPFTPTVADIPYGQTQSFTFAVLDSNCNVLSDNAVTQDGVDDWNLTPSGDLSLGPNQSQTTLFDDPGDSRHIGMALDQHFNFIDPYAAANWLIGGYISVTVANTYMCKTPLAQEGFSFYGEITHNLYLDSSGSATDDDTNDVTATAGGFLEPPPATTCSM